MYFSEGIIINKMGAQVSGGGGEMASTYEGFLISNNDGLNEHCKIAKWVNIRLFDGFFFPLYLNVQITSAKKRATVVLIHDEMIIVCGLIEFSIRRFETVE